MDHESQLRSLQHAVARRSELLDRVEALAARVEALPREVPTRGGASSGWATGTMTVAGGLQGLVLIGTLALLGVGIGSTDAASVAAVDTTPALPDPAPSPPAAPAPRPEPIEEAAPDAPTPAATAPPAPAPEDEDEDAVEVDAPEPAAPPPPKPAPEPEAVPRPKPAPQPARSSPSGDLAPFATVRAFPFHKEADTRSGGVRRAERYSCAPELGEAGPEHWYRVELPEAGTLVAQIPEDREDGIDVDLHLLTSTDPSSCIVRDNERLLTRLEAGTYWLVVDTFGEALEHAGAYSLDVTFEP
jgi:outer membrane biosynthesis protein TonB